EDVEQFVVLALVRGVVAGVRGLQARQRVVDDSGEFRRRRRGPGAGQQFVTHGVPVHAAHVRVVEGELRDAPGLEEDRGRRIRCFVDLRPCGGDEPGCQSKQDGRDEARVYEVHVTPDAAASAVRRGYWPAVRPGTGAGSKPWQPLMGVTSRCREAWRGWPHSSTRSSGAWREMRIWTSRDCSCGWCSAKWAHRPH